MHKGLGKLQQIRGHRRRQKVLNRRLNRYPSDLKKVEGRYSAWLQEEMMKSGQTIAEAKKEIQDIKDSGQEAMSLPEMVDKLIEMKEKEDNNG